MSSKKNFTKSKTRLIPLSKGFFAIIDPEDYEYLNQFSWYYHGNGAARTIGKGAKKGHKIFMHRIIMDAPEELQVDHINHNRLDNRRSNLRLCTQFQNQHNQKIRKGTGSQFKGVSKHGNYWQAKIMTNNTRKAIALRKSEIEAARIYDQYAKKLHGAFASLNFPDQ